MKLPIPLPALICVFPVVGFAEVFQQIPFAVTAEVPLKEIIPPEIAEISVIPDIAFVVNIGLLNVFPVTLPPYPVPVLFMA